jgi:endonuclease/exonuclease/phosphatase family metal-dependent hydrolase
MLRCLVLILLIRICAGTMAGNAHSALNGHIKGDTDEIQPLRILSWNIYLLPVYIFETQNKYKRAGGIADELIKLDYDIIVFQEAFHSAARAVISRKLNDTYPFQYGPSNNKVSIRFNSGIWIISKIPLFNRHDIRYKRCRRADMLARKGAMLMEGTWHGLPFQLIGTHLQADAPYKIRRAQLDQLYDELLLPFSKPDVPQFICGDMNTCIRNCEEYDDMLRVLQADNAVYPEADAGTNSKGEVIDYILVRYNNMPPFRITRYVRTITHQLSKHNHRLSDHRAVEANIFFPKPKKVLFNPIHK